MEWLILSGLLLLLASTCFAPAGMDVSETISRRTWATAGLGLIVPLWSQDWPALALWLVLCGNALTRPFAASHVNRLTTLLACYMVYRIGYVWSNEHTRTLLLIALASLPLFGLALERVYLAQGSQNHADALSTIGLASSIALIASNAFWPVLPLAVANCLIWGYHAIWKADRLGMPVLWIGCVIVIGSLLLSPLTAMVIVPMGLVSLGYGLVMLHRIRTGPDHGRVAMWYVLLRGGWWGSGWRVRLFGNGWDSWASWAESLAMMEWRKAGKPLTDYRSQGIFWCHPHNEYVSILFEHGLACLLCLVMWLAWHGWLAYTGTPMQKASLLPASAMLAIAFTHFPWTFPTEAAFGSMGLVILSLVLAILIG